ncbi:hypothetical protein [Burkholderia sp. 3C]
MNAHPIAPHDAVLLAAIAAAAAATPAGMPGPFLAALTARLALGFPASANALRALAFASPTQPTEPRP